MKSLEVERHIRRRNMYEKSVEENKNAEEGGLGSISHHRCKEDL